MSTFARMCRPLVSQNKSLAIACLLAAIIAPAGHAQVVVDGRPDGITIQGRPVQRTYAQVYSPVSRAKLITKQSVMDNGGAIPDGQMAAYIQPGYGQPEVVTGGAVGNNAGFRLDPYARRRYLNYSYYDNVYYGNWYGGRYGYYPGSYAYQYYPGFHYYWRPSFSDYAFCYRPSRYSCGPRYYGGGSYFRYSSSCGLSFRIRF